ncbi:hypothetical protein V6N11_068857 [Hibiscus sabdariffa]|uniref:Uncharacterized protein n=1 Tax=Hibiscus sabdariffa TaxID=183260 RepID=A0ABR2PBA1_9ROSI
MDPDYFVDNLDMVLNRAEEDTLIEQLTSCPNGAETNFEVQPFQVTNQPHQSNLPYTQLNQAGQSQIVQMKPLLSASTELMHHQPNNSFRLSEINTDELDLFNHHYLTSQFLVDETCLIEGQNVPSLPSQTNQVGQNQIEIPMSSRLNQRHPSQDSGRTSGNQRTAAAIRSKRNRDKKKEMMVRMPKSISISHERLETVVIDVLEEKRVTLAAPKEWREDLEGFRHSSGQISTQNRQSYIATKKMVVKVTFNSDKSRYKALRIAVGLSGVESASLKGDDKSQIELTGHAVDIVKLTSLLRKSVGHAELVSIADYESTPYYPQYYYQPVPSYGYVKDHNVTGEAGTAPDQCGA